MKIYRLMHKNHAELLLKGRFRFGRMRYYQMQEVVFDDDSVGDAEECISSTVVSETITAENRDTPRMRNLASSVNFKTSGDSKVVLKNSTITCETDFYISSWSTVKSPDLRVNGPRYDTCLTAAGATTLAHHLTSSGAEWKSGEPLTKLFSPVVAGRVQYRDFNHDMSSGPLPDGDPFRKRKKYEAQYEYRMTLYPKQRLSVDFICICCPSAAQLVTAEPIVAAEYFATNEALRRDEENQALLKMIVAEWAVLEAKFRGDENGSGTPFSVQCLSGLDSKQSNDLLIAIQSERAAAIVKFDGKYLKELRRCLFALRRQPFYEQLDIALARRATCETLIGLYLRGPPRNPRNQRRNKSISA